MKRPLHIIMLSAMLAGCSSTPTIDPERPADRQAQRLAEAGTTEAAEALVGWLKSASPADRDFARSLTRELMSIYDSDSLGRTLDFVRSLDSIRSTLSPEELAHVYVVSTKPWRLGAIMRADNADDTLLQAIESDYADDPEALEAFRQGYRGEH